MRTYLARHTADSSFQKMNPFATLSSLLQNSTRFPCFSLLARCKRGWRTGLIMAALSCFASADEPLLRTRKIDGLAIRMKEGGVRIPERGETTLDLAMLTGFFGVLRDNEFVLYETTTGVLMSKLTEANHARLEKFLQEVYHWENIVEISRAYLSILRPLPPDERVSLVMRIGYLPDPLIAALVRRIRGMENPLVLREGSSDPFQPVRQTTDEHARHQIDADKKLLGALLSLSLERLEQQMREIDDIARREKVTDETSMPDNRSSPARQTHKGEPAANPGSAPK